MAESESKVERLIANLGLEKHPEGGFFRETYRSEGNVETKFGERNFGTAIYFLLPENVISEWHKVKSDEMWHFYDGSPLVLEMIGPNGEWKKLVLGTELLSDQMPQRLVPKDWWQRAYSLGEFTLVGCTVNPGFDFADFEMGTAQELVEKFPDLKGELGL